MRRVFFSLAAMLLMGSAASSALAEDRPTPAPSKPAPKFEFIYIEMTGVEAAEAPAIANALGAAEGVKSFAWTVAGSEAKVIREVGKASDDVLLKSAKAAGAETAGSIPLAATNFTFEKVLHCGGCVAAVKEALLAIKGVKEVSVSAAMTDVTAVYDSRAVKTGAIEAALTEIERPGKVTPPR